MSFGRRIRELRQERGLTQRELAERVERDFSYISKIENDRLEHTPSIRTIRRLAEALEVDELELMELANKVPAFLEPIVADKDALRFFRRATRTISNSEGWRDLLDYLEQKEARR